MTLGNRIANLLGQAPLPTDPDQLAELLTTAVRKNNVARVEKLLDAGANPNIKVLVGFLEKHDAVQEAIDFRRGKVLASLLSRNATVGSMHVVTAVALVNDLSATPVEDRPSVVEIARLVRARATDLTPAQEAVLDQAGASPNSRPARRPRVG